MRRDAEEERDDERRRREKSERGETWIREVEDLRLQDDAQRTCSNDVVLPAEETILRHIDVVPIVGGGSSRLP